MVIFSLRAVQAHNTTRRESQGLAIYMQVMIGTGFIAIVQDLMNLLRVLLVKSTVGTASEQPAHHELVVQASSSVGQQIPLRRELNVMVDNPSLRLRYRRFSDALGLVCLSVIITGVVSSSMYGHAMTSSTWSMRLMQLRWVSLMLCAASVD